jgi:Arc/MetJ-type ribon-helix-helix transcriptional regulator
MSHDQSGRRGSEFEILVTPPKKVISIKLDADLIDIMDSVWKRYGYSSRSEFIREAILFFIAFLGQHERPRKARLPDENALDDLERALEDLEDVELTMQSSSE